ncbi:uncharacterized protein K452DRAFT_292502 [Aplosporella prunicola CBS 121167]|uniref:Uncharacterized protein n=1 Tax=Aplosporella prunicola CBS 121167 TaxID=1176127 RepID=A0A6A6AXH1_9PEZI|nr:uncharacterized protein K452DRAFT_292502 [Aplosporella prunicola CBS 121167]KAF2136306.1 hypothetical protein K452DRAFT_292502 [Aplosporella prunicola CBS 121167]
MEACPPALRKEDIWDYLSSLPPSTREEMYTTLSWIGSAYLQKYGMEWREGVAWRKIEELRFHHADLLCTTYMCMEHIRNGMANVRKQLSAAQSLDINEAFGHPSNWWTWKRWETGPYNRLYPIPTAEDTYVIDIVGTRADGEIWMMEPNEDGDYLHVLKEAIPFPVGTQFNWRQGIPIELDFPWVFERIAYWHWAEWKYECLGIRLLMSEP